MKDLTINIDHHIRAGVDVAQFMQAPLEKLGRCGKVSGKAGAIAAKMQ